MKISNKSYINKDFQTIYPELVDNSSKLTNRINLRATNESDPIIVLMKQLAMIGDKLNLNIDFNVLQSFPETANQREAFEKQAEVNGYTMQYYQSASTKVTMMYSGELTNGTITFYPFETKFTDANSEVIYTMVGDMTTKGSSVSIAEVGAQVVCYAYEGEDVDLSINGVTDIQLTNLDDENKLFLPEQMIASNIIFVKNSSSTHWTEWEQVDNLNTTSPLSQVFKFGFDSSKNLPYIEFPNDIEELIGSGLNVKYFRTNGVSGNIIAKKLTQLKTVIPSVPNTDYLYISNLQSALNGRDAEGLDEAYKNYKKTIGVFNTLVTTNEYGKYLYRVKNSVTSQPLVSNILVTDRRTDTNLATPIVSYDEKGVLTTYNYATFGVSGKITPFDLVLYPLTPVTNIASDSDYNTTYTPMALSGVTNLIDALKGANCIDHTFLDTKQQPIDTNNYPYLYKNMYELNCRISTVHKVNDTEQLEILANVRQALYDNFNAREVEYGKEIDFDDLLYTIEEADTRIKNVSLDEPEITTKVCLSDGSIASNDSDQYVDRVFKNVAAGRLELYNYNNDFKYEIGKKAVGGGVVSNVTSLEPILELDLNDSTAYTLKKNQVVQLYAQSYGVDFNALYGVLYNYTGATIGKDEVHRLGAGEVLYLNTKQDDVTYTLKYTSSTKAKYDANGSLVGVVENVDEVIIQPNFQLATTGDGRHDIVVEGTTIHCNMLGTSEKISFMKKTVKTLTTPTLAYWFVNNANNELFTASELDDGVYTHLLDENEYLFLTDATKTQLTVLGSGTLLSAPQALMSSWKLDRTSLVTLETFSSEDISTYGAISWVSLPITNVNNFIIAQQQIITLVEDDNLKLLSGTLTIDEDLHTFGVGEGVTYNNVNTVKTTSTLKWSIRTRLDLGISYDVGQELSSPVGGVYREKLIVNGDTANPVTNCYVQSYYPCQTSNLATFDDNEIFKYTLGDVTYTKNNVAKTFSPDVNGFYTIKIEEFTSGDNITIPLTKITGNDTGFMLYFSNPTSNLTLSTNDITTNLNTGTTSIIRGINNLVVGNTNTVTLTISKSDANDCFGVLTIAPIRLYNGYNEVFNLTALEEGKLALKLANIKTNFYFFYDVPNTKIIDVTDYRDANALWEVNDILNKKTLPQIDFANSVIKIIKSSRK